MHKCCNKNEKKNRACKFGFKLNLVTLACDDINECEFANVCPESYKCVNINGSYRCLLNDPCRNGWKFNKVEMICEKIENKLKNLREIFGMNFVTFYLIEIFYLISLFSLILLIYLFLLIYLIYLTEIIELIDDFLF